MKKILLSIILSMLILSQVTFAQDVDFDNFNPEDFVATQTDNVGLDQALGVLSLIFGALGLIVILPIIGLYVYFALALSTIAKKTNTENPWFAWIPILNVILMWKISGMRWWTLLLILVPIVNIVIVIMYWMKIAEKRGKPSWMGILMIVPIINFVIPGVLAWSNEENKLETRNKPNDVQPTENNMLTLQEQEKLNKMADYVKQNLSQGYDINNIKTSLIDQGFDPKLIEKAILKAQSS